MTIANSFAAKLSVAFVAVAMALSMVAPAQAQTAEELQAQIDTLMATIASLQGTPAVTASGSAYVFTRPLTIGSEGADVTALQTYLIAGGYSIPAGATGYFGAQTAAAVAAWQTANGVMPAAGYFGPVSQAKYNALMAAVVVTPDEDEDEDEDDETETGDLQGEASLETVEIADGEDDEVEEGQEAAPVAEITVEFVNGDAEISRIDVALDADGSNNGDVDPWDNFDEVSLWVDGDEVATIDASDEDEYLDEDFGSLRFSDLDIVAMEDEEVTIVVGVTMQSSIDGVGSSDTETWNVAVGEIRFVDADDVTTTEDNVGDQEDLDGSYTATAEFVIEEAGAGDELDLKASADEPDEQTLQLSESDSEEFEIFAFMLDADDSDGDIELDSITVDVEISSTTGAIDDLVSDFRIEIDGESFDAESYVGTGDTAAIEFDIDGDVTIEAGESATVVVFADFDEMESDSQYQGTTITASVDTTDVVAEGTEDITVGGSNQDGEAQTLRSEGIVIGTEVETSTDTQGDDDTTGIFEIEFDVTALEGDFYINDAASTAASNGVQFAVQGATTTMTASGVLASTADDDSGAFFIADGETETFTLTVTVDPAAAGQFRVALTEVWFTENSNGTSGVLLQVPTPESTYRTNYQNINN